ncbi:hypothetical protein NXV10_17575 [Bacteroides thetaiotaomicron]|nr:hypothetical protein [Bacteroides thetaiotaomicron]
MIRQEQLSQWLGDRQRKYADGLVLFNALAKEAMKKKFAAYLAAAPEDPHIFDPHFTQLVNCLSKLDKEIKFSPSLYPAAMEEIVVVKTMSENDRKKRSNPSKRISPPWRSWSITFDHELIVWRTTVKVTLMNLFPFRNNLTRRCQNYLPYRTK